MSSHLGTQNVRAADDQDISFSSNLFKFFFGSVESTARINILKPCRCVVIYRADARPETDFGEIFNRKRRRLTLEKRLPRDFPHPLGSIFRSNRSSNLSLDALRIRRRNLCCIGTVRTTGESNYEESAYITMLIIWSVVAVNNSAKTWERATLKPHRTSENCT